MSGNPPQTIEQPGASDECDLARFQFYGNFNVVIWCAVVFGYHQSLIRHSGQPRDIRLAAQTFSRPPRGKGYSLLLHFEYSKKLKRPLLVVEKHTITSDDRQHQVANNCLLSPSSSAAASFLLLRRKSKPLMFLHQDSIPSSPMTNSIPSTSTSVRPPDRTQTTQLFHQTLQLLLFRTHTSPRPSSG